MRGIVTAGLLAAGLVVYPALLGWGLAWLGGAALQLLGAAMR